MVGSSAGREHLFHLERQKQPILAILDRQILHIERVTDDPSLEDVEDAKEMREEVNQEATAIRCEELTPIENKSHRKRASCLSKENAACPGTT
ncbi:hypothetical protein [Planctomicrobium sp. SH527]|uniref:hypothetical protein n=1 Tax=Planctomicrobium sp. SH527 TaxID=3448123 RepID=UPI003F5B08A6